MKNRKAIFLTVGSILAVLVLWAASFYFLRGHYPLIEHRGQFGDTFGAVNALFSGLAFALLITTIILQRDDLRTQQELLRLQQEELKLTREEFQKSVEAQQQSSHSLKDQKEIMQMQNSYNIVFTQIEQFNRHTDRLNVLNAMRELANYCGESFADLWVQLVEHQKSEKVTEDINVLFVQNVYKFLPKIVEESIHHQLLKSYVQFAANVLFTIKQHKKNMGEGRKEAIFLCQLEVHEAIMLYLATIYNGDMPICQGILWENPATTEITNVMKRNAPHNTDFSEMNISVMTEEFKRYRGIASYEEENY